MSGVLAHIPRLLADVRGWLVWSLPRWLAVFVITVVLADLAAIGAAAPAASFSRHNLALFAVLTGCTAAAAEITRKTGERGGGRIKDVHGVWELPAAVLLPPFFALVIPVVQTSLTQWRVRRAPLHRRVFTGAAVGLSYGAASAAFHWLPVLLGHSPQVTFRPGLAWTGLAVLSALIKWGLNKGLVIIAVKGADRGTGIRAAFFGGESLYNDGTEICIALLVTYSAAGQMLLALAALPVVTLLQRSLTHVQLVSDSRKDSKTGLLNAATWQREAAAQVTRAVRTGSALAIAMIDIDRFKAVNDTYGHLAGDQVLKEIGGMLGSALRENDLAGRFGGEEFSLLLPQTQAVDALRAAERVRAGIAAMNIIVAGPAGGEQIRITVSIGIAALDNQSSRGLDELVAVADTALYRAKSSGRDQVQMISTTRGLSAASGPGTSTPGHSTSSTQSEPDLPQQAQRS